MNELISDTYAKDYYAKSPSVDPTGPNPGTKSHMEYRITAPKAGPYDLSVRVVTANEHQRLNVAVNDDADGSVLEMPFTLGDWQTSRPVRIDLAKGENVLRLWRDQPPQYGMAVKEFTLKPAL